MAKKHFYSDYRNGYFNKYSFEEDRAVIIGEYKSDTKLNKADLVDSNLVDTWTQADIDALNNRLADEVALLEYKQEQRDGQALAEKLMMWAKRQSLTSNQISTLKELRENLRDGDWQDAKNLIDGINRDNLASGVQAVYDKVKAEIYTYLGL